MRQVPTSIITTIRFVQQSCLLKTYLLALFTLRTLRCGWLALPSQCQPAARLCQPLF